MKVLSHAETIRMLSSISLRSPFGERNHAMLELALHTGLRVSELAGLDIHHVTHGGQPRQALHLPASLAKGARERTIPLNAVARQAIATILDFNRRRGFSVDPGAPLLVNRRHQRLSVRYIQRLVQGLRERAGLDVPATPHTLRHSFATNLSAAHGNLRVTQKILGHRRLTSTEIYTHPTCEEMTTAVQRLAAGVVSA